MNSTTNRQRAAQLSRRLNMPPGKLLHVVTRAGLDAIADTLERRAKVAFPLVLATAEDTFPPLDGQDKHPRDSNQ